MLGVLDIDPKCLLATPGSMPLPLVKVTDIEYSCKSFVLKFLRRYQFQILGWIYSMFGLMIDICSKVKVTDIDYSFQSFVLKFLTTYHF